MKLLIIIV